MATAGFYFLSHVMIAGAGAPDIEKHHERYRGVDVPGGRDVHRGHPDPAPLVRP
jgi:hypothetical protein